LLNLENVTVVCVTSVKIKESIFALEQTAKCAKFADIKLITDSPIESFGNLNYNIKVESCPKLDYIGYSKYIIYDLYKHIESDYVLVINWDGFILNPNKWDDKFLEYDYIGALWTDEHNFFDENGNSVYVGNGGFSLRSKKLLELASKINIPWTPHHWIDLNGKRFENWNEDAWISVKNRHIYEEAGCKWAPKHVSAAFSHEYHSKDLKEHLNINPFGFHGKVALKKFKYT